MDKKTEIKILEQTFNIRGEEIDVSSEARYDLENGELIYDQDLDDKAIKKAYRLYRQRNNFLNPEEIKAFREEIGISQRDFATLMGWSPTTVVMYEAGSLPTINNNGQLKNIFYNPDELVKYLESNGNDLSQKTKDKITFFIKSKKDYAVNGSKKELLYIKHQPLTGKQIFHDLQKRFSMPLPRLSQHQKSILKKNIPLSYGNSKYKGDYDTPLKIY